MQRGNEYVEAARALKDMLAASRHLDDCLEARNSPLTQQICYGVCRHYFFYREILDQSLDKPLPDKHLDVKMLLLAGLYSMDNLHRPAHASVNRVVEATTRLKKGWAKGMVNAVLRRYGRERERLTRSLSDEARLNHPQWLISEVSTDWPNQSSILECNNQQAPMTLRINARKTTVPDYITLLANEGIEAHAGELSPHAVTLSKAVPVTSLPGFTEGLVSVQDEAPQLAASLLNLHDGARVLDACAAPGGKTCHLLESANIELTAVDRDAKRIHHIRDNLDRLSLQAEVVTADLESWQTDKVFDRILLDVPCSATGIIRRHPDIKLLRSSEDVDKLASTQRGLLDKAFDLLGPGGELLYSTCSILERENDKVIADFLAGRQDATLNPIMSPGLPSTIQTRYGLQLLPTMSAHDGFFYSSILKSSGENDA